MTRVAFTVGFAEGYDEALERASVARPPLKRGRHDEYRGGWVWPSAVAAERFLESLEFDRAFPGRAGEFAVYRLELPTSWGVDVERASGGGGDFLLHDARIVERVEVMSRG